MKRILAEYQNPFLGLISKEITLDRLFYVGNRECEKRKNIPLVQKS